MYSLVISVIYPNVLAVPNRFVEIITNIFFIKLLSIAIVSVKNM
jgi:hypothetical protein